MVTAIQYNDPSFDITEAVLEKQYELPRGLMRAIRTRGEKSNNNQVSPKGAKGVYQFMPATFTQFADPGASPTDPDAAAVAAARYLSYAMKQYGGNVGAVAAEYNGGPKAAKAYLRNGDPGNKETRDYVQRVMGGMGDAQVGAPRTLTPQQRMIAQTATPASPFGGEEYTTPVEDISPAQLASFDLDSDLQTPDMDLLADNMLDTKIGSIVDEVLNG